MAATLDQLERMQEAERQVRIERDAELLPEVLAALTELYDQCVNGINGPSPFCLRRALTVIDKAATFPTTVSRLKREDGTTGGTAQTIGANHEDHSKDSACETGQQESGESQGT